MNFTNSFRKLLIPFSFLFGIIVWIRNLLYDFRILKQVNFKIPVISIGNLSVGGTGKTPHVEFILRALPENIKAAVLSRGYKRKTKGFMVVENYTDASEVGDEPCQLKHNFPNVIVAVCENRVYGIKQLLRQFPDIGLVILDDAFQHRRVLPQLSVLLFDYNQLFKKQYMLPAGNLRELFFNKSRADIFIVTKTPVNFSDNEKGRVLNQLKPKKYQEVYFSYIVYGNLIPFHKESKELPVLDKNLSVLLFCGIANPKPLINYLETLVKEVILMKFPDHHFFTNRDLSNIIELYKEIVNMEKCMVTTQKDAMRLYLTDFSETLDKEELFYLPIKMEFHENKDRFLKQIVEGRG